MHKTLTLLFTDVYTFYKVTGTQSKQDSNIIFVVAWLASLNLDSVISSIWKSIDENGFQFIKTKLQWFYVHVEQCKVNFFLLLVRGCKSDMLKYLMCLVYQYRYGSKFYSWLAVFLEKAQAISNYRYEPKFASIFLIFLFPCGILIICLCPMSLL